MNPSKTLFKTKSWFSTVSSNYAVSIYIFGGHLVEVDITVLAGEEIIDH